MTLKHRVALVTEWASTGNSEVSSSDVSGLQTSIEGLFTSVFQRKHYLYRQNDRDKKRQNIVHKISPLKKRLLEEMERYNQLPDAITVDMDLVVQKLSSKLGESLVWPGPEQSTDGVDILTKKEAFRPADAAFQTKRGKADPLKGNDAALPLHQRLLRKGCLTGFSEEGSRGLICLLRRRLEDLRGQRETVLKCYRAILHSEPSPWLEEEEERAAVEDGGWQHDSSSDAEEDDDDGDGDSLEL